jgi:Fic family protein
MDNLLASIRAKNAELDWLRAHVPGSLSNLDHARDLELTYTSNAIEGNSLTAAETTRLIEQGIAAAGKPVKDHLETLAHHDAIRRVRELAGRTTPVTEMDIRGLLRLLAKRSRPDILGRYADRDRDVPTDSGRHAFPSPAQVPALMGEFAVWLRHAPDAPETAFRAHRDLVRIHPFNDGNGRVARLLMNLILIRGGYPPVAVRPVDRPTYIRALQIDQSGRGSGAFDRLLYRRLDATLDECLTSVTEALPAGAETPRTPNARQ